MVWNSKNLEINYLKFISDYLFSRLQSDKKFGGVLVSPQKTILVIEDDAELRDIIGRVLSGQGYFVMVAASGATARSLLSDFGGEIDILLSDVILPDCRGREIAGEIRESHPSCKVLFMSGYLDLDPKDNPEMDSGSFLQKPFTIFTLARKIREILDE